MKEQISLTVLDSKLAICQFLTSDDLPSWATTPAPFMSVTHTEDEISVVLPQDRIPDDMGNYTTDWCAIKVDGKLDFSLTGILYSLLELLNKEGISVFVISTYNTDYIMVREMQLPSAIKSLGSKFLIREGK